MMKRTMEAVGFTVFLCAASGAYAALPEGLFSLSGEGSVGSWLMLAPIPNPAGTGALAGLDQDLLGGEAQLAPTRGQEVRVSGKTFSWTPVFEENPQVALSQRFEGMDQVTAYLYCVVESQEELPVVLQIGRDDAAKVWLDGEAVLTDTAAHGLFDKRTEVAVTLKKGRQPLLVKVSQDSGFWGFGLMIKDANGLVPQGVRVVLPGNFEEEEYLDHVLRFSAPPLVDQAGNRVLQVKATAVGDPAMVESIAVVDLQKSGQTLFSTGAMKERRISIPLPRSDKSQEVLWRVTLQGKSFEKRFSIAPCRNWRVYLLPGSHVDIGYTNLQAIVLDDHKKFFKQAMDLYEQSLKRGYMHDAHYRWNPEVTWVIKHYLAEEPEADRETLLGYLRRGVFSLDALYCNLLTALCGDEEIVRSVYYATHLAEKHHLPPVISAMITDVPGYTWGTVPVLADAGVKYFQLGPNFDARIGFATKALGPRPYYWIGPDGQSRVLVWNTGYGYASIFNLMQSERGFDDFLSALASFEADPEYPYDVAQFRSYFSDNTPPPAHLSEVVQEWNSQYQVPRLIMAGTPAPFEDLVSRYADKIPSYQGDYTPYWEDGAASSARETAMNRQATLRLQDAEIAWTFAKILGSECPYPQRDLETGYDFAMLYSEHTWGAHNSISQPDSPFAQDQWRVKRSFAENALWRASQMKDEGLKALSRQIQNDQTFAYAVWNLSQWPRSDWAVLPYQKQTDALSLAEQWVAVDAAGNKSPVYKNEQGYVFRANEIPAFGYKVYQFLPESYAPAPAKVEASAAEGLLRGGPWEIKTDLKTGAVQSIMYLPLNRELVDAASPYGLNQYLHVLGPNGKDSRSADQVIWSSAVSETGAYGSLIAQVKAPGVEWLRQEIQLHPDQNRIEFINTMDKSDIRDKEAVRFAFPFLVAGGGFTMEIPLASMRPEKDQIPGANRNYYTVRRWIDASNDEWGVTLVAHDAPLLEFCGMHAEQPWLEHLPLTNTHVFSYAMNNYWFTNYKASQGGPAVFRYSLVYHDSPFKPSRASRFADQVSSPLCVMPLPITETSEKPALADKEKSLFSVESANVLVQIIKQAEDGQGLIIRFRELDGVDSNTAFHCGLFSAFKWQRCDLVERPIPGEEGQSENGILPVSIRGKAIQTYRIQKM
ncbi:MAG TPA: glycoside hydrolase family 38 C-terminal domain-containing protein [bacterium]|nr:glycoside hydrolase family 38 C-terminal domain-containing protein [bacterium]